MQIMQKRRDFLASASMAAAAEVLGIGAALADEPPPEVTMLRLRHEPGTVKLLDQGVVENPICIAPQYLAEELLSAEGFSDVRYISVQGGRAYTEAFERGELDLGLMFAPGALLRLDGGAPLTGLAGIHPGCFELFVQEHIRSVADLKGKQVGISEPLGGTQHLYVSVMAAHVGLDPQKQIGWVTINDVASPLELFVHGKIDAYLAFVPQPQQLRARKIGRAIVNMAFDRPWSQYYCCMLVGRREFVRNCPVATKRAVRAILKATDLCSTEPERVAQRLIERGFAQNHDYALQILTELPCNVWRELDPEDSLRFYGLWLHEFGISTRPRTS
jgi:NitT/TauT family transport system substrate-binding protein